MSKRTVRNRISHAQFYKLCDFLNGMAQDLPGKRPLELAQTAASEVGFVPTELQVKDALEATGLSIAPPQTDAERIAALEVKVARVLNELGLE